MLVIFLDLVYFNTMSINTFGIKGGVYLEKLIFTVSEIAELLNLSTATIYSMVRNNEIPYKKLRGKIVFHRETIEKWLAIPTA